MLTLDRITYDLQTLGLYTIWKNDFPVGRFACVELPWLQNQPDISCIPTGTYEVIKHVSPKFGPCFWVQDVPNRSEILIHVANYTRQLRGCQAPGLYHFDLDRDGRQDVAHSAMALKCMYVLLPDRFTMEIRIDEKLGYE